MLTLELGQHKSLPLYLQIYHYVKGEILSHRLRPGTRLPSKRALAAQLGTSVITIEGAYEQLIAEGYIYSRPKSGYYVSSMEAIQQQTDFFASTNEYSSQPHIEAALPESQQGSLPSNAASARLLDLSSNSITAESFPFNIWSRLLRQVVSQNQEALLTKSPTAGVLSLRQAIAEHLLHFRGMKASPEQIIIGAGTEYLYELIIKLIGRDKIYCVEDPGYQKLQKIYQASGACCLALPIDQQGMSPEELAGTDCDVIHISPSHHFPTGIITPISRRYELLAWAAAGTRYIIEDDYDTEFRLVGRPIPSLFSIDMSSKVVYMNTFSKSLASTIRISYMVLPQPLLKKFNRELGYLSCTVSTFEQYTLAEFIRQGYFERHINRMRNSYRKLRQQLIKAFATHPNSDKIRLLSQASGLYFLLQVQTELPDKDLQARLRQQGLMLHSLRHYYQNPQTSLEHTFVMNYSSIAAKDVQSIVNGIFSCL